MNQRPGKRRKAPGVSNDMNIVKMCRCAAVVLKADGKEDEAFYFEQIKDYLKDGGELDPSKAARALGL